LGARRRPIAKSLVRMRGKIEIINFLEVGIVIIGN